MSERDRRTSQLVWLGRIMVAGALFKVAATVALGLRFDPTLLSVAVLFALTGAALWLYYGRPQSQRRRPMTKPDQAGNGQVSSRRRG